MKKIYLLFCLFSVFQSLGAQKNNQQVIDTISKRIDLDEVVVSSSGFAERKKNIAQKIEVISAKNIVQSNSQNTGDLLMNTGKIFVQKSQQGGSSPIIRGFEASRILIVIDGVRLNNAIFRSAFAKYYNQRSKFTSKGRSNVWPVLHHLWKRCIRRYYSFNH